MKFGNRRLELSDAAEEMPDEQSRDDEQNDG
jgi:hypothetical protein